MEATDCLLPRIPRAGWDLYAMNSWDRPFLHSMPLQSSKSGDDLYHLLNLLSEGFKESIKMGQFQCIAPL